MSKVECSTHGSRACWEGKGIVPCAFCLGKQAGDGGFGRLQSQKVPELGPGLYPPLSIWRDLSFRARLVRFLEYLIRMWEPEPPVEQADYIP